MGKKQFGSKPLQSLEDFEKVLKVYEKLNPVKFAKKKSNGEFKAYRVRIKELHEEAAKDKKEEVAELKVELKAEEKELKEKLDALEPKKKSKKKEEPKKEKKIEKSKK